MRFRDWLFNVQDLFDIQHPPFPRGTTPPPPPLPRAGWMKKRNFLIGFLLRKNIFLANLVRYDQIETKASFGSNTFESNMKLFLHTKFESLNFIDKIGGVLNISWLILYYGNEKVIAICADFPCWRITLWNNRAARW